MHRPQVLVLDDWEGVLAESPGVQMMREVADVRVLGRPLRPTDRVDDIEVVFAVRERTRFDAATFDRFPALKLVLQSGAHAYHLDADAARERGIAVVLGGSGAEPRADVPELTFGLMIGALRHFSAAVRRMGEGGWPTLTGRTLAGRKLGILGMGRHGREVARIATAFRMNVVAWARDGVVRVGDDGVPRILLGDLMADCDVVSIHLKLSDESKELVSESLLRSMKPGAVLINTARGAIVDEPALVRALREGPLVAAGLDVFAHEPLAVDSPLRALDNVLLTPHIGWTVEEILLGFAEAASRQLRDYVAGQLDHAALCPEGSAP